MIKYSLNLKILFVLIYFSLFYISNIYAINTVYSFKIRLKPLYCNELGNISIKKQEKLTLERIKNRLLISGIKKVKIKYIGENIYLIRTSNEIDINRVKFLIA